METLYKRSKKGEILVWNISIVDKNRILTKSGKYGGKMVEVLSVPTKPVKVGRIDEVSSEEQTIIKAKAKIKDNIRKGYSTLESLLLPHEVFLDTVNISEEKKLEILERLPKGDVNASGDPIPMLCQPYYRTSKNWVSPEGDTYKDRRYYYLKNPYVEKPVSHLTIKFPLLAQPKINGIRCIAVKDEDGYYKLITKYGKKLSIPHVTKHLNNLSLSLSAIMGKDLILDGELYIENTILGEIVSAVTATSMFTYFVKFYIFDIIDEDLNQLERTRKLKEVGEVLTKGFIDSPIVKVDTKILHNDMEVQIFTDNQINLGYEGAILRNPKAMYRQGKRTMDMVKLKRIMDDEFEIVDVVPQKADPSMGLFVCRTDKKKVFKVTPTMSEEAKREILDNRLNYIGKKLTCWFYEYTDSGIPYHVIDSIVRDYE